VCWKTPSSQRETLLDGEDPHTVAATLKQFWRKHPEPLFPYSVYSKLIACAEAKDDETIVSLFNQLQPPRSQAATALFSFLATIASYSHLNLMSSMNLAICFAPNILRPKVDTMDTIVHDTPKVIACVCVLIDEFADGAPPRLSL